MVGRAEDEEIIAAVDHVVVVIAARVIGPTAAIMIMGRGRGGKGVAVVDLNHVVELVIIVVAVAMAVVKRRAVQGMKYMAPWV